MAGKISTDYSGHQLDLLAVDPDLSQAGVRKTLPLRFRDPPYLTAGLQQTVQAFLSLLLTKAGHAYRPGLGTRFVEYIQTRNPRSETEIRSYYQLSAPSAIRQVNSGTNVRDEQIREARLVSALVDLDRISLRILLITEAGERADFLAPVPGV